jgi:nuclear pore complex protein Nup133
MLVRHLIPEERHHSVQEDFYRDAYTGEIDTVTGFALVASMQTCFVWQHAQVCDQLSIYSRV